MTQAHHILHVLVDADRGGCERACDHICHYLPDSRHTVVVLAARGEMSENWERVGARVEHLDIMRLGRLQRTKALRTALSRIASDGVIIWHGMAELPMILHVLPAACGPVLIHGGNPANSLSRWNDWRYLLAERLFFRSRHDPIYTCCSQYVCDSFIHSRYLRRFRRCAVTNGVDPLLDGMHTPRALPPPDGEMVIGMLARLDTIKDHPTLLRAFARVRESAPRARLALAGDGDQMPKLRQLAMDLGLGESVEFLGTVKDIYGVMARWDLFAYATTKDEGFGIALAEALMCGLPAVVTDVGPVREVCGAKAENVAMYVPPHDSEALATALLELISDFPRRQALAANARHRANTELSAEVFAQRYGEILARERKAALPTA